MLVGSLREVAQLEVTLQQGFYHIPLENISGNKILTQIEYIALYQSKGKFAKAGETGINWDGRVLDWKVLRRKEITERPARKGTEEKLYVKFTVEKWMKRDKPIVSGGRGIYTAAFPDSPRALDCPAF